MHDLCINCQYFPNYDERGIKFVVEPYMPDGAKHSSKTMAKCPILQLKMGVASIQSVTCPKGLNIVAKNLDAEGDDIHANPSA